MKKRAKELSKPGLKTEISKCKHVFFDLPAGWTCIKAEGFAFLVTRTIFRNSEGESVIWESRHQRKHHFKWDISNKTSTWFDPKAIGWWIAILFATGSILFALGAVPDYLNVEGNTLDGLTFFVGSLFFTSAAFLQYLEALNTSHPLDQKNEKSGLYSVQLKNVGWWVSAVQFLGTLFFNISTFSAILNNLSISQINHLVWAPDAYGSTCFLVASILAWIEVNHSLWTPKTGKFSWWIAGINTMGSIFFGISAVGAFILPTTGFPLNVFVINIGTFLGALCFFGGAILLLPERTIEEIG